MNNSREITLEVEHNVRPHDGFELFLAPQHPAKTQIFSHQGELSSHLNVSNSLNALINRPTSDVNEIETRQSVVEEVLENPETRASIEDSRRRINSCRRAANILTTPVLDTFTRHSTFVDYPVDEIIRYFGSIEEAVAAPREQLYKMGPRMIRQVEALRTVLHSPIILKKAADTLNHGENPFFEQLHNGLNLLGQSCTKNVVTNSFIRNKDGHINTSEFTSWAERLNEFGNNLTALVEFADIATEKGFAKVTFDLNQPIGYEEGLNANRLINPWYRWNETPKDPIPNDSLPDEDLVVISGSNMSGKSFLLEQTYFEQLLAQSLGYVPARKMNARPYSIVSFIDRASTDAAQDLSALGSEIVHWQSVLKSTGENGLVLADESFSTTAPEDQHDLLVGISRYLGEIGIKAVLSSHNEAFIREIAGQPNTAMAHLAVQIGENGDIEFLHKLQPGSDESHAIEVARLLGFPENIVANAEAYLSGELPELERRALKPKLIEIYTDDEREQLKQLAIPISQLLNPNTGGNEDTEDFEHSLFWEISDDFEITGFGQHDGLAGWSGLINRASRDSKEIHERQKLYGELIDAETWQEIAQASNRVMNLLNGMSDMDMVSAVLLPRQLMRWTRWRKGDRENNLDEIKHSLSLFDIATEFELTAGGREVTEELTERVNIFKAINQTIQDLPNIEDEDYDAQKQRFESALGDILQPIKQKLIEDGKAKASTGWSKILEQITEEIYDLAYKNGSTLGYYLAKHTYGDEVRQYREKGLPLISVEGQFRQVLPPLKDRVKMASEAFGMQLKKAHERYRELSGNVDESKLINKIRSGRFNNSAFAEGFELWEYMLGTSDVIADLVSKLRATDSVHLNQAANHLEKSLANALPDGGGTRVLYDLIEYNYGDTKIGERMGWSGQLHRGGEQVIPITTLLSQAAVMRNQGYQPVSFTQSPKIKIKKGWSPVRNKKEHTPNSIEISETNPTIFLTGANMSGKTSLLKQAVLTQVCAQATGYAPAKSATLPILDHVVYIDRVQHRSDQDLSAYGSEIVKWNSLLGVLPEDANILIAVDEPFSTTSPTYQEALTYATVGRLQERGAFGIYATHNHALVDKYLVASEHAEAKHLKVSFDDKTGEIKFHYKLQAGHAPSYAIAVASVVNGGLPAKVIEYALESARQREFI